MAETKRPCNYRELKDSLLDWLNDEAHCPGCRTRALAELALEEIVARLDQLEWRVDDLEAEALTATRPEAEGPARPSR
jgi:hypothetical protein